LAEWAPLADISEDDKEYLIKLELPEVKKEDVNVTVENGVLTISGERKFEKEEKNKKYHRVERAYGSFMRRFTLPDDADAEKGKAEFKDGMLTVHVSKSEKAKPNHIGFSKRMSGSVAVPGAFQVRERERFYERGRFESHSFV
jgi:HSP20 family protein